MLTTGWFVCTPHTQNHITLNVVPALLGCQAQAKEHAQHSLCSVACALVCHLPYSSCVCSNASQPNHQPFDSNIVVLYQELLGQGLSIYSPSLLFLAPSEPFSMLTIRMQEHQPTLLMLAGEC